ncbi:MAG: non-canonical purine NTP pyrophosphatase [Candidatus Saccharimonadales bacterium]
MKTPIFITGNQNKADFLAEHLGIDIKHHKLDLDEIQSLDPHEVVAHKVRRAYEILHKPVLVEDAGLTFTAMGQLPGTLVKWFLKEIGREGLIKLAKSLPYQTAYGQVCYGLYDGENMHFFDGEMHGHIAGEVQAGPMGFGFDSIFINDGFPNARAQMSKADYDRTSYRTPAIKKLREFLKVTV